MPPQRTRGRAGFWITIPSYRGLPTKAGGGVTKVVVRIPWKAGGLIRCRSIAALAWLAVLAGMLLGHPVVAPAQAADPHTLWIIEYGGDRAVLDGLIDDLMANSGPEVRTEATRSASLAGYRAFCQQTGGRGPDILLTTRRLARRVASVCAGTDARPMVEIELGHGAMVLAVRRGSALSRLTSQQVYLALARDVPYRDEFRRNTAVRWSDIDRSLPAQDVRFQLPPRDDGSRAMFETLVLQGGCRKEALVKGIFSAQDRTARCVTIRVDRVREIRRDQAVQELLEAPEGTVGVLSYPELARSGGALVAIELDGVAPTSETIEQGSYNLSDSDWMYVRRGQQGSDPAVDEALTRQIARAESEAMIGPDGVLERLGLVPLPADQRAAQRAAESASTGYSFGIGGLFSWIGSAFGSLWGLTGVSFGEINPPDTTESIDLTKLMDIAGYKIKEFETKFGIIPDAGMTFGIAREMSDADLEYLERTLYRDSHRRTGLLSAVQRRIVRTIIDVSSTEGYEVSKVDIDLFPLPSVKLVVTPAAVVMGPETTLLMRAIDHLNDHMNELVH